MNRYFAHIYEQEMQACGYRGSMLYWDWGQSASDPLNAPIFSDSAGLGGNGVSSPACQYIPGNRVARQCVVSGPFAQLRPAYYQGSTVPHSLHRCFNCGSPNMFNESWMTAVVFNVLLQSTYTRFSTELYIGPHLSIHDAIGGDFPTTTSPNGILPLTLNIEVLLTEIEPLFWPHHVQVDRIWWIWQNLDPANRMFQYEGKTVIGNSPPTRAVMADVMHVLGLASDAPVSEVMNTEGGFLCYRYEGL
jgi:tyrosinase